MHLHRIAVISFFMIFILAVTVSAQNVTITLSDLNLQKGIKVVVYDFQGNYIGEFNTTDTVLLNMSKASSYVFVLKPTEQVWFSNPLNALELFKASFPSILSYLLFFAVVIGSVIIVLRALR